MGQIYAYDKMYVYFILRLIIHRNVYVHTYGVVHVYDIIHMYIYNINALCKVEYWFELCSDPAVDFIGSRPWVSITLAQMHYIERGSLSD